MAQTKPIHNLLTALVVTFIMHFAALDFARAQDAEQLYQQCVEKEDTARQACTTASTTAGMDPAQQQQMAYQQSVMMQQSNPMMSPQAPTGGQMAQQAKTMGIISGAQAAISGIKATACGTSHSGCQDVCKKAADALIQKANEPGGQRYVAQARVASEKANQCQAYKANMGEAIAQMVSMLANMLQNMQMAKALSTAAKAGEPTPVNCNDPNVAKTNTQCICQTDPKNPICGSGVQQGIGTQMTTSPSGVLTPSGAGGPGNEFPNSGDMVEGELPEAAQERGTNAAGGGGGGGPSGGGGGGAGNFSGDGGYEPSAPAPSVITGQSGGSGGGLSGGGGSGGGSSGGSGGGESSAMSFDLSKYLPNKKDFGNRGLAGMSVTAKDGITGPMGPSIWEKVSNQYQMQKPKLIQDR